MARAGGSEREPRRFILGTAGHVDHGKTELVRALTGHDTDRLAEEKRRGISILLGFAPLPLDEETFIGVVDVPGHERFVKQMVAGAGGIDMAMLLVAADEGVMPQTEEHMAVLDSLGIGAGLVVISKSDLASDDTRTLLHEELAELTRGTFLEGAPVIETSARTGAGVDDLRAALRRLADAVPPRASAGPFRLAVDRVFHRKGIGVVVTGSCYSGTVAVGDALQLLPSERRVRIRGVQSFGDRRDRGVAGERLALALQGVRLEDLARGDMLCTEGAFAPTSAIDVRLRIARYADVVIRNRERVRVHHGAREVMGRVILLDADAIHSGERALAQLRLEAPLVAAPRDRVVIRKYSPARVIGGGVTIDAAPPRHKRFDKDALETLRVREAGDPRDVLLSTLVAAGTEGLAVDGADKSVLSSLVERGDAVVFSGRAFDRATIAALADRIASTVSRYLDEHPLQWGMDKEELRQRVSFPHPPASFNQLLDALSSDRSLVVRGNRVRAGSDDVSLSAADTSHLSALSAFIRAQGVTFPSRAEVERAWTGTHAVTDALQYLRDHDEVVEVGDTVMHRDAFDRCMRTIEDLFREQDAFSVGDFKDALGLTRKHAIPLLEAFDNARITSRRGDRRARGAAFQEP